MCQEKENAGTLFSQHMPHISLDNRKIQYITAYRAGALFAALS